MKHHIRKWAGGFLLVVIAITLPGLVSQLAAVYPPCTCTFFATGLALADCHSLCRKYGGCHNSTLDDAACTSVGDCESWWDSYCENGFYVTNPYSYHDWCPDQCVPYM